LETDYTPGNPRWNGSDRLIVLSGCSGGGKSTLLAALAARGHATFPEPGRQVVREELHVGGPALPWTDPVRFAERCLARATFFFNTADARHGPVFFDRGIVDAVTHLDRLGAAAPHAAEAARRYRYGRVFFLPPWQALFATGPERRHSFAEAVAEYDALLEGYSAHGYTPVVLPQASVADRLAILDAALSAPTHAP
jgi:predicted ATPase